MIEHMNNLPPAMANFLAARKAGAQPVTTDGKLTIFAQEAAKAGVPFTPPQGETPADQQGIASIVTQAQQAGPTIANNQQQAQQQQIVGQAAQQAAQMLQQPQAHAEGGLATLPVHMQEFKEGGVIGFDGTSGSYVNTNMPNGMQEQPPEEASSAYENLLNTLGSALSYGAKTLGSALSYNAKTDPKLISHLIDSQARTKARVFDKVTPSDKASLAQQAAQLEAFKNAMINERPATGILPDVGDHAMAVNAIGSGYSLANQAPSVDKAGRAITPATAQEVSANKKAAGIVSELPASKTASSIATKTKGSAAAHDAGSDLEKIPKPTTVPLDTTEQQAQYEILKAKQANKPDFASMGIADIQAAQQRDKDTEAFRRYAAIFGARQPGINAGSSMIQAAGQFVADQNKAENFADAAKTALLKAKQAESEGDTKTLLEQQKEFQANMQAYRQVKAQMDTSVYASEAAGVTRQEAALIRAEAAQQVAEMRMSMAAQLAQTRANGKNPYDVVNDNYQKALDSWMKTQGGMGADSVKYDAMRKILWDTAKAQAKEFGYVIADSKPTENSRDVSLADLQKRK